MMTLATRANRPVRRATILLVVMLVSATAEIQPPTLDRIDPSLLSLMSPEELFFENRRIRNAAITRFKKALPDDMKNCRGKEKTYDKAAVVTDVPQCSKIGTDILRQNGSVVDAFIAAAICLGTVNGQSSGIGGGFFMTYYNRKEKRSYTLDAYAEAPLDSSQDMYDAKELNASILIGGKSIAVPGEVAGYWKAHQAFGRLQWAELFKPSIKLCETGVPMTPAKYLSLLEIYDSIKDIQFFRSTYFNPRTGKLYRAGETTNRPIFCATLRKIARNGASTFYTGSLSKKIIKDLQEQASIITAQDLKNYNAKWRRPVEVKLNGNSFLHTVSPPASGAVVAFILNILNGYNSTSDSSKTRQQKLDDYQRYIEATKFALAARSSIGDPAFVDVRQILKEITSPDYAETIRKRISDDVTHDPLYYNNMATNEDKYGTSHISIVAPDGDALSATTTVYYYFGSAVIGKRTNIIFNDIMDHFMPSNRTVTFFGANVSHANDFAPRKRPMSAISPVIVTDELGDVTTVIGASGAQKITSTVAYVLAELLFYGKGLKESVDAPRLHPSWIANTVEYEVDFSTDYLRELVEIGHLMRPVFKHFATVQAISRDKYGRLAAYADMRKDGCPDGI